MPHGQRDVVALERLEERDADFGVRRNRLERDLAPLAPCRSRSEFTVMCVLSAGVQFRSRRRAAKLVA
jgi:hypothetical protein